MLSLKRKKVDFLQSYMERSTTFYTGCPQGRPCQGLGRVSFFFFTRDARRAGRVQVWVGYSFLHGMPAGKAVSRFGSAIFFLHGMPAGQAVSRFGSAIFFFFFVVATNLHINLFIKLSPLLEGMYCSNCLQQKRPNENLLLARISRGREPPHPYLCDVNSSFDLFIKPGLNSGDHIAYKFQTQLRRFKTKINPFEAANGKNNF